MQLNDRLAPLTFMASRILSPIKLEERQNLDLRSGDTIRVWQKIQEKGKTRLQAFEGLVLARKHGKEAGGTFTVRRMASGVGVEKIFPLYSPLIDKIEVVKRSKIRQAKLYHIRRKAAKEIKRQMRNTRMIGSSTDDLAEEVDDEVLEAEADNKEQVQNTPKTVTETREQNETKEE